MKFKDTSVSHGGLMRCCLAMFRRTNPENEVQPGYIIQCSGCEALMKLDDEGVWRWVTPKELEKK